MGIGRTKNGSYMLARALETMNAEGREETRGFVDTKSYVVQCYGCDTFVEVHLNDRGKPEMCPDCGANLAGPLRQNGFDIVMWEAS